VRGECARRGSGAGQEAGVQAFLADLAAGQGDLVSGLAGDLRDRFGQLGAAVDQAGAVVGGVAGGQDARRDELVEPGAALLLGVVVDAVGVGQEGQAFR
jgi:hypothetical protein